MRKCEQIRVCEIPAITWGFPSCELKRVVTSLSSYNFGAIDFSHGDIGLHLVILVVIQEIDISDSVSSIGGYLIISCEHLERSCIWSFSWRVPVAEYGVTNAIGRLSFCKSIMHSSYNHHLGKFIIGVCTISIRVDRCKATDSDHQLRKSTIMQIWIWLGTFTSWLLQFAIFPG